MVKYPSIKVLEDIEELKGKTIQDTFWEDNYYVLVTTDKECIRVQAYSSYDSDYMETSSKGEFEQEVLKCYSLGDLICYLEDLKELKDLEEMNKDTSIGYYETLIQFLIRNEVVNKEEYANYLNERKQELILENQIEKQNRDKVNEEEEFKKYLELKLKFENKGDKYIAIGKGNSDWNYSAPHGAGRIMSRSEAKKKLNLEDDIKNMEGIYSTTVNENTLDESSMAYKPMQEILDNITDTVDVIEVIKPIYNYKDSSESLTSHFIEERKKRKLLNQKSKN